MGCEDYTGYSFVCSSSSVASLGIIGGFESDVSISLLDKVAKGGWGQVYLAEVDQGGFVAVKVGEKSAGPLCIMCMDD